MQLRRGQELHSGRRNEGEAPELHWGRDVGRGRQHWRWNHLCQLRWQGEKQDGGERQGLHRERHGPGCTGDYWQRGNYRGRLRGPEKPKCSGWRGCRGSASQTTRKTTTRKANGKTARKTKHRELTMEETVLKAEPRMEFGSRSARRLRRKGHIPANIYGHKQENVLVSIDAKDFSRFLEAGHRIVTLSLGSKSERSVV